MDDSLARAVVNAPDHGAHPAIFKGGTLADDLSRSTGRKYIRIDELDSMRGVAALNVVILHFASVLPAVTDDTRGAPGHIWLNLWKYSPLHFIGSGSESVIFFFVLSGFVLALPYQTRTVSHYGNFLMRRFLRLYPPYIVAVAIAVSLRLLLPITPVSWASAWFNGNWGSPLHLDEIVKSILFVVDFNPAGTVPPAWSLLHEMRISIIFPAILILARIIPNWILLFLSVVFSFASYYCVRYAHTPNNIFLTGIYVSEFVLGVVMARYFAMLRNQFARLSPKMVALTGTCALICYTYPNVFFPSVRFMHLLPVDLLPVSLAAAWAIVCGVECAPVSAMLKSPFFTYFGKTSYSLYLYHLLALLAVVHLTEGMLPVWCIWIIALLVTLVFTHLSYRYIEIPSIALIRRFSSRERAV